MIYFDNAATSYPKPPEVFESMSRFMHDFGGNPGRSGHRMATGAEAMIGECRNALSKFFGAKDPERCVFTLNCTDALNMAIKGVIRAGNHVVTTALEHNSISRPLQKMADDGLIELTRVVPAEHGCWHTDEIINACNSKTRLVAVTHCANATGVINNVADLGAALREISDTCVFLVDAAQTAGVVPLDMEAAHIDLLAFPGHKGLFAPTGTGALLLGQRFASPPSQGGIEGAGGFVSPPLQGGVGGVNGAALRFWREGGTGGDSTNPHQPDELPHRLEGGTPNTMGIAGLLAGIRFINKTGVGKTLEHEREILKLLIGELQDDKRFTLYGTKDLARKVGVLSLTIADRDNAEVASILDQAFSIAVRPGLHCAPYAHKQLGTFPTGTLRLSPGYFNTLDEAREVVKALKEIAS